MTIVITCAEARVDLTGIEGGGADYAVLRTVGGRITRNVLAQLAILRAIDTDEIHVVVVHHTECRAARLADPELATAAAEAAGIEEADIAALVVANPTATVTADVAVLRRELPRSTKITGMVYDGAADETKITWRSR